jgi:hypothetical protein
LIPEKPSNQILDSCRLIIDSSGPFANDALMNAPGRPPATEVMDRMITSANLNLTMLEAGLKDPEVVVNKMENGNAAELNGNGNGSAAPSLTSPKSSTGKNVHYSRFLRLFIQLISD